VEHELLERCQQQIGYQFKDLDLLELALTHSSVAASRVHSNERLEFLGDAVLGLSVCSWLYENQPDLLEGEMTKIKSAVVSRRTCAEIVEESGLNEFLLLGNELADPRQVPESILAAVLEAIIGAIYVDGGYEPADHFIRQFLKQHIADALDDTHLNNFKSLLQQHAQKTSSTTPQYLLLDEQGPDHSKCFEVAVAIDGQNFPSAWGRNKKEAEQAAALRALETLGLLEQADD
jgi:ribonuclease-3